MALPTRLRFALHMHPFSFTQTKVEAKVQPHCGCGDQRRRPVAYVPLLPSFLSTSPFIDGFFPRCDQSSGQNQGDGHNKGCR